MSIRKMLLPTLALMFIGPILGSARSQETPPSVVVRVRSFDTVIEHIKLFVSLAGREEAAKQIEGLIKTKIGANGLEGVDPSRPFGGYVRFGKDIDDISGVLLVPIADEKAFLTFLDNANVPFHKGKNDIYTVQTGARVDVYFRFANKHAYVTALQSAPIEAAKLPDPAKLLGGDKPAAISIAMRLDQLPEAARFLAQTQVEAKLQEAEDKGPANETEAQKAFRIAALRGMAKTIIGVLKDSGEITADLDFNQKKGDFSISLSMAGVPKSDLAATIKSLGEGRSQVGHVKSKNNALFGGVRFTVPPEVSAKLTALFEEGMAKALAGAPNEDLKNQLDAAFKSVLPTLKAGEIDAAIAFDGPNKDNHFTFLAAAKVRDGDKLAQRLHALATSLLGELPDRQREKLKLDFDSVGAVKIHRLEVGETALNKKEWPKGLGEPYIYLAVRNDAIFVAAGGDGIKAIKAALATDNAAPSPVLAFEVDLARIVPLVGDADFAKNLFGKELNAAKVRIRVDGGDRLSVRIDGGLSILQLLGQANKRKAAD